MKHFLTVIMQNMRNVQLKLTESVINYKLPLTPPNVPPLEL